MRNFNDLWIWLIALKSSIPFVTAVAILFAGLLATIVDWIELYLTADQHDRGSERSKTSPSQSTARHRYIILPLIETNTSSRCQRLSAGGCDLLSFLA